MVDSRLCFFVVAAILAAAGLSCAQILGIEEVEPPSPCGNGELDEGELCDGAGCPTSCPAGDTPCAPVVLLGNRSTCDARCVVVPVTICRNGDGCCPDGCALAEDDSCPSVPNVCGDGLVLGSQVCDDGTGLNGTYGHCNADCTGLGPRCGDGVVQAEHEGCEPDGQTDPCPYGQHDCTFCDSTCHTNALGKYCGNGVIDAGHETCDDNNTEKYDGCDACSVSELAVNGVTGDFQESVEAALNDSGDFVVAWDRCTTLGPGVSTDLLGVYARVFTKPAISARIEVRVDPTSTDVFIPNSPSVVINNAGKSTLVWQNDRDLNAVETRNEISARNVRRDGTADVATETVTQKDNLASVMGGTRLASNAQGDLIVVYNMHWYSPAGPDCVYGRALSSDLSPGPELEIACSSTTDADATGVVLGDDDRFVVVWLAGTGTNSAIKARVFTLNSNQTATPYSPTVDVSGPSGATAPAHATVGRSSASFVVAWSYETSSINANYRRFSVEGDALGETQTIQDSTGPHVAMNRSGSFVIAYETKVGTSSHNLLLQRYGVDGTPILGPIALPSRPTRDSADDFAECSIAMDSAANTLVVWSYASDSSSYGENLIYAQRVNSQGQLRGVLPY